MNIIYILLFLGSSVGAAKAQGLLPCDPEASVSESTVIEEVTIELGFDITSATLVVYDRNGDALTPTNRPDSTVGFVPINGCDLELDMGNGGRINAIKYEEEDTAPFVTIEITVQSTLREPVTRRLVYGTSTNPTGGPMYCSAQSFFCPNYPNGISNADIFIYVEAVELVPEVYDYRLSVASDTMTRGTVESTYYIDNSIFDGEWVFPYHALIFCAGGACNPQFELSRRLFVMPVDEKVVRGQPLTKRIGATLTMATGRSFMWDEPDLTLAFRPGTRLEIESTSGSLLGTTLTAANPVQGWLGVRYNAGSDGSLTNVTVERVGQPGYSEVPWAGSAITITNASPSLTNVTIQSPASPNSGGVRVSGVDAAPVIKDLLAEELSGTAIQVTGGARADVVRGQLLTNAAGVVASGVKVDEQGGGQTTVYFVPHDDGTGGDYRGPIITGSTGQGVSATTSAEIRFGAPSPVHGYTTVTVSVGRGLNASSGAALYAGTATVYQRNVIFGNLTSSNTGNVRATGVGSRAYVNCNWWGPQNDFRSGQTNGGTLVLTAYLTASPFGNPNPPCAPFGGGEESRLAGTAFSAASAPSALRRDSTLTARLLTAVEATPADALVALVALVDDAPESEEAGAAIGEIGSLAGQENGPDGAHDALNALTIHTLASLRVAAWQALVVSRSARGDVVGALSATDALDAEGAVVPAEAARVSLHAAVGDTTAAVAALGRLEAAAPSSVEAAVARATLGMGPDPFADDMREAAPEAVFARSGESHASAALSVAPNPASTTVTMTMTLDVASEVHVTVHDLLGRVVAVVSGGVLEAGTHRVDVPVAALAPGVYVARVVIGGAVQTAPLTVTR